MVLGTIESKIQAPAPSFAAICRVWTRDVRAQFADAGDALRGSTQRTGPSI